MKEDPGEVLGHDGEVVSDQGGDGLFPGRAASEVFAGHEDRRLTNLFPDELPVEVR